MKPLKTIRDGKFTRWCLLCDIEITPENASTLECLDADFCNKCKKAIQKVCMELKDEIVEECIKQIEIKDRKDCGYFQ